MTVMIQLENSCARMKGCPLGAHRATGAHALRPKEHHAAPQTPRPVHLGALHNFTPTGVLVLSRAPAAHCQLTVRSSLHAKPLSHDLWLMTAVLRGLAYGIPQWNYSMEKVEYPWNVECLETAKLKLSKYSEYPMY